MKPFRPSILCKRLACLLLATWWGALSSKTLDDGNAVAETVETLFLQVALETGVTDANLVREPREQLNMTEDLQEVVFMHIPYNFGHTIEKVAFLPESQAGMANLTAGLKIPFPESIFTIDLESPVRPRALKLAQMLFFS